MSEFHFTTASGSLSATLTESDDPCCSLLLAHGAGADHKHVHMESLARAFAAAGITTLRFNFPFKEQGRSRVDSKAVSMQCIEEACKVLADRIDLPMFIGGHSFGGRMATHLASTIDVGCKGLILCSFPLHPVGKPGVDRVLHFKDLKLPALFLSGTRDTMAEPELLEREVGKLGSESRLHWLDTADHSFKILKRKRVGIDVYDEAAETAAEFAKSVLGVS